MEKKRLSNIELLKIFAMFAIIFHHFNIHGTFNTCVLNNTLLLKVNNFFSAFMAQGGKIGVAIFILITGYFMINSTPKIKNFLNVYIKTLFYSILFLIVAFIHGNFHVSSYILNSSLFPFFSCSYWFITYYLILYVFSPVINIVIKSLDKKNPKGNYLLFLYFLIAIVVPTFFHTSCHFSPLAYFIFYYIVGALIRLEYFDFISNKKFLRNIFIISLLFAIFHIISRLFHSDINLCKTFKYSDLHSLFTLIFSVCIFQFFLNLKINYNKFINWVSNSVFAVYLIHDNNFVRPILWKKILCVQNMVTSEFYILKMILIVFLIFTVCILIDKIFLPIQNFIINNIGLLIDKILKKIIKLN